MTTELHQALRFLASRCDGAHQVDGQGFSRFDHELGVSLAQAETWTPRQAYVAHRIATKYRRQLQDAGIALPPAPVIPAPSTTPRRAAPGFRAEIRGEMVMLTSSGFPGEVAVAAVRQVTGRTFSKSPTPAWWVPMSSASELLRLISNGYAHADVSVLGAIRAELVRQAKAASASQQIDAEISIDGLGGELRPFQRAGVAYASEHRRCFIADEMGLGKTVQALATLWQLKAFPAVVVCPASLKLNWEREARKWLPRLRQIEVLEGGKGRINPGAGLVILNYDILDAWRDRLVAFAPKSMTFDECHYLKSRTAQRTKAARSLGAMPSLASVLMLSGTPVVNSPAELITQLEILGRLRELGGWKGFTSRYLIADYWGGFKRGGKNLEELNAAMRSKGIYIRRLKKDVLTELPEKQRVRVPIQLASPAAYQKTLKATAKRIAEARAEKLRAKRELREPEGWALAAAVTAITELRKAAALGKLEAACRWLVDMAVQTKVVVFAHHREIVLRLAEELKAPVVMGDMKPEDRQASVDRFQSDPECRAIVLNLRAGGVGLTLTAASNVVFVESGFTPADNDQAEDRCHRMGQRDSVTAWYLEAAGTIDEWLADLIAEKRKTVDATTEGSETAVTSMVEQLAAMVEAAGR